MHRSFLHILLYILDFDRTQIEEAPGLHSFTYPLPLPPLPGYIIALRTRKILEGTLEDLDNDWTNLNHKMYALCSHCLLFLLKC